MPRSSPVLPLALLGVAALVVAGALLVLSDDDLPPAPDAEPAPAVVDIAEDADDAPAPAPSTALPTPLTTDGDGDAPDPPAEPEAPPAELRVLVVDEDDEPLADIPVALRWVSARSPLPQDFARDDTAADGLAVLDLSDVVLVDGAFSVPEGRLEIGVVLPLTPPVALDLGPSVTVGRLFPLVVPRKALLWAEPVRVLLLDDDDRPVPGETISLQRVLPEDPGDPDDLERVVTDASGIAALPRDRIVENAARFALMGFAFDHRVALDGPFEDPPSAPVPSPPDGETIVLRLPPCGTLAVRVVDHEGAPVDGATVASWSRPAGADDDMRFERSWNHIRGSEGGVATYEHVGLGLEFRLSVSAIGTRGTSLAEPGPTTPGEVVELRAQLGEPLPWLTGRVLDADGEPVEESFHVDVRPIALSEGPDAQESDEGWWFAVRTDADGRFRQAVLPELVPAGSELAFEERPRAGVPQGSVARTARVALPAPFPVAGDVDVGDLVLEPLPLIVGGTVTGPDGAPVRAWVSVRHRVADGARSEWHNMRGRVSTDREGRFAYHALDRPKALLVQASHRELGFSEAVEAEPGASDVRLELVPPEPPAPSGVVEGTVLTDPGIPPMALEIFLRWDGGSEDDYVWPGAGYRFADVPPGAARVVIDTQETEFEVASVSGIEVRVGETTRVDPIDLRGRLGWLDLVVLKDDGKPVSDSWCWIGGASGGGGSFRTSRDGRARLLLPTAEERFVVWTNHRVKTPVAWSDTEQTVVLASE